MKIGIFTDPHYSSAEITCGKRYNSQSLRKIEKAVNYFAEEKCDLILCLGDLIDREKSHEKEIQNLRQVAAVLATSNIPTFCIMGNHDAFAFSVEEFYEILGKERKPVDISNEWVSLLFLDTCYFQNGIHYMPGDSDWTDTFLPNAEELKNKLSNLKSSVYIFLHQNLDPNIPDNHRVANDEVIRKIIETSGIVKKVYQGHYHPGNKTELNGIEYVTFPAMCENEKAYFIVKL